MVSNHIKIGLRFWIAAFGTVWASSKHPQLRQHADQLEHIGTFGLWGGGALLLVVLLIVRYVEKAGAGERLTELHQRVQSGETVEIRGGSGLARLIVLSAFAWTIVYAIGRDRTPDPDLPLQACFGIAVVILTLLELLTVIPLLRQPILRISRDAVESPLFGKLLWQDVAGLDLREVRARHVWLLHHRLHLVIPSLPTLTPQLHPATRLEQRLRSIFRPSTELSVRLLRSSEMPKVILTLCERTCSEYARLSEPRTSIRLDSTLSQ